MIVIWRITQRCNLSCPFCAYDRRLNGHRRKAAAETIRHFGKVLADHQQATGESILVSWMGGEPFLYPGLEAITQLFTRNFGLRVSATTNGTALGGAALREHILEHYTELTISVDGIGEIHDQLRAWPGGYELLRKAVGQLCEAKRVRGQGPRLRANVVLMRQTIADFERLCREITDWGIEEITFNQLGGRDRPEFYPEHRLLPAQATRLGQTVMGLREHLATRGVRLQGSPGYLTRIEASSRGESIPVTDCHPGEQFLFINEDGIASPCHFTSLDYGIDVKELTSAHALSSLPVWFAQKQRQQRSAFCEDCHSTRVFDKFAA